ncbi:MAG TPA: hypothetical protein VGK20_05635 [Candidatus Binatia bacterium]
MTDATPLHLGLQLAAAYFCFYAPGQLLVARRGGQVPVAFARVLASTVATTVCATALAVSGKFSLPSTIAATLVLAAAGAVARTRWREPQPPGAARRVCRDPIGLAVVAAALLAYWPGYPAFLGASDSSAYLGAGVWLAHHGTLALHDDLGPTLPAVTREVLFDSMSQATGSNGPPYRRLPGGIVVESLDDTEAWPAFFPVPSVWAALFATAGAPGLATRDEAAPGYAPVFGALALWAFSMLARCWCGPVLGLVATALLGASEPFYYFARMPTSEAVAAFFTISTLAVLSRTASSPRRDTVLLAGAALGAAVFTRIEVVAFLAMALCIQPASALWNGPGLQSPRRLTVLLLAPVAILFALAVAQAVLMPGTWALPVPDLLENARIRLLFLYENPYSSDTTHLVIAAALAAMVAVALSLRRLGWKATLRWCFLAAVLGGHWMAASFLFDRTPMWLSFYVGSATLALAAAGFALAWQDRDVLAAAPLALGFGLSSALILFYNPHVYPELVWGGRRFVPLLLPMLLLLATYCARKLGARSRLLMFACLATMAFAVHEGAGLVWNRKLFEDGYQSFRELAESIPPGGTVLVDRDVSAMMISPALWMLADRNNLTVPSRDSADDDNFLPGLVWYLTARGPVYYVSNGVGAQDPIPHVRMTTVTRPILALRVVEETYDRLPNGTERDVTEIGIFRLERSLDPRGTAPK